jgi:hypothetical protein
LPFQRERPQPIRDVVGVIIVGGVAGVLIGALQDRAV